MDVKTKQDALYKRVLSVILALAVLILALPAMSFTARAAAASEFSGGTGTEEDPYLISKVDDLVQLANKVNISVGSKCEGEFFRMTGDIDLKGEPWTPIGGSDLNNYSARERFSGIFDGGGHEIKGLNVADGFSFAGLFGAIDGGGTIMNLTVSGSISGGTNFTGGIAAYNNLGTIDNCVNKCNIASTKNDNLRDVGGIAGYNTGTISNCRNEGTINGINHYVGGIVGRSTANSENPAVIENCWNEGEVSIKATFTDKYVGGIVGNIEGGWSYYEGIPSIVKNCYNIANISNTGTGENGVGGIAGCSHGGIIENCYNIGVLSGAENDAVGGIAGYLTTNSDSSSDSEVTSCYYLDTAASGYGEKNEDSTITDLTKVTSDQLKEESTFKGWDFDKTWNMRASLGRPVLLTLTSERLFEGSGTEDDPYVIDTAGVMQAFAQLVNGGNSFEDKFVKLGDDIDLSNVCGGDKGSWEPVGIFDNNDGKPFEGTFDGGGHTISGLYIDRTGSNADGLFGHIGEKGTVKNLTVEGEVKGGSNVGGIAGRNDGTISNCHNDADVECESGGNSAGGVAGYNQGTVENCYNTGDVSGSNSKIGGVIGDNAGDAANNYYLKDTAIGGIDGADVAGKAESMTEAEFKYGEVAFLLQETEEQDAEIFWGQQLSEEPLDDFPILTDDESLRVVKFDLKYTDSEGEEKDLYTNSDADKAPVPGESTVTVGGTVIEFPDGGFIDKDFAVTVPEDGSIGLDDHYTVKLPDGGAAQANDEDGTVTVPAGTVITDITGAEDDLTVPDGKVAVYDPRTGKFTLDDAPEEPDDPDDTTHPSDSPVIPPNAGNNTPSTGDNGPSAGDNSDPSTDGNTDTSDSISADDINVGSVGGSEVTIGKDSVGALKDEVIASHLTDGDKAAIKDGNKLDILLSAEDAGVPDADKQAAGAFLDGTDYTAGRYLNIDLLKQINGEEVGRITELDTPITLVFIIPEELRKENRVFGIVRIHEGETKFFEDTDNDPDTITIVTDRFSTYIIVYKDLDAPVTGNPGTGISTPIAITGLACAVIASAVTVKKKKMIKK